MCFYLLNRCVNHSVLSFFSFLCDNLLLQKCVQSLCEITVFLCVNLIDPASNNNNNNDRQTKKQSMMSSSISGSPPDSMGSSSSLVSIECLKQPSGCRGKSTSSSIYFDQEEEANDTGHESRSCVEPRGAGMAIAASVNENDFDTLSSSSTSSMSSSSFSSLIGKFYWYYSVISMEICVSFRLQCNFDALRYARQLKEKWKKFNAGSGGTHFRNFEHYPGSGPNPKRNQFGFGFRI